MSTSSLPTVDQSDEFYAKYPPDTTLPQSSVYSTGTAEGNGMYEWDLHDREVLAGANPLCLWTVIQGDDGTYMTSGIHFVNREAYYISSVPRAGEEPEEYCINVDEESDDA